MFTPQELFDVNAHLAIADMSLDSLSNPQQLCIHLKQSKMDPITAQQRKPALDNDRDGVTTAEMREEFFRPNPTTIPMQDYS